MNMRTKLLLICVALAAAASGGFLAYVAGEAASEPPQTDGVILDQPRLIPEVSMRDHHGERWTPDQFEGDWTLVFFGFTNCPDVCPETMIKMNRVDSQLRANGDVTPPRVLFVSVDPKRDTPDRLADYVPYFNEDFLGVTGNREDIAKLSEAMGVPFMPPAEEGADDYLVDHGASLTLVGPDGHIRAFFTTPHDADRIADDLELMIPWLENQIDEQDL